VPTVLAGAIDPVSRSGLLLLGALGGLWWLLSDGETSSWLVGIPVVSAAAWASHRLGAVRFGSLSWLGLSRYVAFFVWESILGGIDVARRVIAPRMRISPGFASYQIRLRQNGARLLFANSVSLMPGTLAADLRGDCLEIHALDIGSDFSHELRRVEAAVGRVFGEVV
jgi:multicomponent Na+:H+ antiporter subunit E